MNDLELALFYKPYIMLDIKEPFEITGIGYTVFRETKKSSSFPKRSVIVDKNVVDFVIEYSIWYDYDIGHLYELEHLWVYVDYHGKVIHAEGSFHGKYLNMLDPDTNQVIVEDEVHLIAYAQPGKHAFLPRGHLFRLVPQWYEACNEFAGVDGVLIPDMFKGLIRAEEETQREVKEYIKKQYSFEPLLQFEKNICGNTIFMSYEELYQTIPDRVNAQLNIIHNYMKNIIRNCKK